MDEKLLVHLVDRLSLCKFGLEYHSFKYGIFGVVMRTRIIKNLITYRKFIRDFSLLACKCMQTGCMQVRLTKF